jgi:sulfite exporter TauE/SafE
MLSALGIPAGAFLLALLSGQERIGLRRAVAKWCLIFGSVSTALAIFSVATHFDPVPTRGVLGMAFIGLPALPAGLLLYFFSRRAPSQKKATHNGHA